MAQNGSGVLCVGALHWDVIGRAETSLEVGDDVAGRVARRPGGVATNVAVGLAVRGCPVGLCSVLGEDFAGRDLIRALEASGVECRHVVKVSDASTGHYVAIEDLHGELIAAVADAELLETESEAVVQKAELALSSVHTVFLEANLTTSALTKIAVACKHHNVRIVANPVSPAKADRLSFLLSPDYRATLVTNLAEANVLLRSKHAESREAAIALFAKTDGTALVTDGARAACLVTPEGVFEAIPPDLPQHASVTGAGDALLSAFLVSQGQEVAPAEALEIALNAAATHMTKGTQI